VTTSAGPGPSQQDHYSYSHYADPATARTFDDRRFGGPIGDLIARDQARVLTDFAGNVRGSSVLDVGTGTGRAALILARQGAKVTGVDASDQMLQVARQRAVEQGLEVAFGRGDAHALGFPDRSFDIAVSFRVLMHTPRWRTCVAELCRVADRLVIVDYPARRSVAALQAATRRAMFALGRRTEPYRVFSHREVAREFAAHGFRIQALHRQFVLPIAVHKLIGSRAFTLSLEGLLGRWGLLHAFGSPVTILAERCARS
jgi:2-polyprenyl-3-methyl-5-hydroxy-6-metoxy-1,4-benzoquinol methylase